MAERMIIEPVKRIAENYLETRNKVIENCWCMIVGNDTPKQEDGWLEVMNGRQTENGIANIYNFMYKGKRALTLEEVDRKSTRLNSSHSSQSRMPSSA